MNLYSIKDWSERYENNRTRELKKMDWIPVPNKQDGEGYTLIMEQKDGPALFGAWMAILQVASKCGNAASRGVLMRDTGIPHDSASIARQSRFPQPLIERALQFLSSREIGWMQVSVFEEDANNTASSCDNPAVLPHPAAKNGREGMEGKEENGKAKEHLPFTSEGFLKAWDDWKQHRKESRKPMTPMATGKQLSQMEEWGEARSIAAINHSIKNGYQGIFEEKGQGSKPPERIPDHGGTGDQEYLKKYGAKQ